MKLTLESIQQVLQKKGYRWFDDGKAFHLNIIGIRTKERRAGKFDDIFVIACRDDQGRQIFSLYKGTTDPGLTYLLKPLDPQGCFILAPGQYVDVWAYGSHKGKYAALDQVGPMRGWRDNNKNGVLLDGPLKVVEGLFGIEFHRAHQTVELADVGPYSAGCQVVQNPTPYGKVMGYCLASTKIRSNRFSYTLLEEADVA